MTLFITVKKHRFKVAFINVIRKVVLSKALNIAIVSIKLLVCSYSTNQLNVVSEKMAEI
jgi:hypothetical protein